MIMFRRLTNHITECNVCSKIHLRKGRSGLVSTALSSGPEGPGSSSPSVHGEIPPYTLMVLGACKLRCGCSVFQVFIENYTSGDTKARETSPPWQIKIMMTCLRTILRDESQTIGNCVALVLPFEKNKCASDSI